MHVHFEFVGGKHLSLTACANGESWIFSFRWLYVEIQSSSQFSWTSLLETFLLDDLIDRYAFFSLSSRQIFKCTMHKLLSMSHLTASSDYLPSNLCITLDGECTDINKRVYSTESIPSSTCARSNETHPSFPQRNPSFFTAIEAVLCLSRDIDCSSVIVLQLFRNMQKQFIGTNLGDPFLRSILNVNDLVEHGVYHREQLSESYYRWI